MEQYNFMAEQASIGLRLDKFLTEQLPGKTRSSVQQYIEQGYVLVNQKTVSKNYKLKIKDNISVSIPAPVSFVLKAENIPLDIVHEDDHLLVVNKPKGMVVHPAAGNHEGTLVNALLHHCGDSLSNINDELRPGIVHRIDKDTSGLLIVAKDDKTHQGLALQIKEHRFTRRYQTVVYGNLKEDKGTINQPIGRHPAERKKMAVTDKSSRNAITHYQVVERFGAFTHLDVTLETGRTHQIRVHMAYMQHPVAGDKVYGPKKVITALQGQCLHAYQIGFIHPITGKTLSFTAPLPAYFTTFLDTLKKRCNI